MHISENISAWVWWFGHKFAFCHSSLQAAARTWPAILISLWCGALSFLHVGLLLLIASRGWANHWVLLPKKWRTKKPLMFLRMFFMRLPTPWNCCISLQTFCLPHPTLTPSECHAFPTTFVLLCSRCRWRILNTGTSNVNIYTIVRVCATKRTEIWCWFDPPFDGHRVRPLHLQRRCPTSHTYPLGSKIRGKFQSSWNLRVWWQLALALVGRTSTFKAALKGYRVPSPSPIRYTNLPTKPRSVHSLLGKFWNDSSTRPDTWLREKSRRRITYH